ncbi:hypothetical protein PFLUV_G00026540 [Perca fluviatilis]|uniref:Cadherin domain-containing protein n=1 Tax=Perca fluviatilis TaxID=8168 RepID=A0A6A5FL57_PERFL|nr:hypothetical protein PFLUV_G00026540 [Perca fluviatilis]
MIVMNKNAGNYELMLHLVSPEFPYGLGSFEVIQVVATDIDQPDTDHSDIRYRLISQEPQLPSDFLFVINPVTGVIRVNASGLDREKYPMYTLVVQAADMAGDGLTGEAKVILTVTDSNDNAPASTQPSYEAEVDENKVDAQILTMSVTDGDEPHSLAWNARFGIVHVVVTVQDINEAPVLDPVEKHVVKREDLAVDSDVVQYTASDPDRQKVT